MASRMSSKRFFTSCISALCTPLYIPAGQESLYTHFTTQLLTCKRASRAYLSLRQVITNPLAEAIANALALVNTRFLKDKYKMYTRNNSKL